MSPGVLPPSDLFPAVWAPLNGQPDASVQLLFGPLPISPTALWKNQNAMFASPSLENRSPPKYSTLWPAQVPVVMLYSAAKPCSRSSLSGDGAACCHFQLPGRGAAPENGSAAGSRSPHSFVS